MKSWFYFTAAGVDRFRNGIMRHGSIHTCYHQVAQHNATVPYFKHTCKFLHILVLCTDLGQWASTLVNISLALQLSGLNIQSWPSFSINILISMQFWFDNPYKSIIADGNLYFLCHNCFDSTISLLVVENLIYSFTWAIMLSTTVLTFCDTVAWLTPNSSPNVPLIVRMTEAMRTNLHSMENWRCQLTFSCFFIGA